MAQLRPEDLNWSLKRGCDSDSTASAFGSVAAEIHDFIRAVRAKQASGTGSQWMAIEDFSNRIQQEAVKLISDAFLDPDVVKWFVQQESHIRDPENYLAYLADEAARLDDLQTRLSAPNRVAIESSASPLDRGQPAAGKDSKEMTSESQALRSISVFISHSSQDAQLAGQLVDLMRSALNLRAETVRCTSVDGYRLPAGVDSDEQLRDEALQSVVFIGILSPFSMASAYVLFELGARWGAKKPIIPLLAPGMGPQALRGPLVGLNAVSCDSAAQLHQLVADVSRTLRLQPEGAAVYQRHVDAIVYSAHAPQTTDAPTPVAVAARSEASPPVMPPVNAGPASVPAEVDEYAEADEVIARHCEREWPDDYNMRAYCIKQQNEAVASLKAATDADIPTTVFQQIRRRCAREWPDDYNMRRYSEQQQISAYRQMQKGARSVDA